MELNAQLIDITRYFGALRFVLFQLALQIGELLRSQAALADTIGTSVGLPQRWQFRVIPAAAALTTSGLAHCWHLKRRSPVSFLACGRTGFTSQ